MKTHPFYRFLSQALLALVLALGVTACATSQDLVFHSFGFDLTYDDQDAGLVDYRYGDSKLPVRPAEWALKEGRLFYFNNVTGEMLRGGFLYVKWKILSTGEIFEDTVDLRNRLPFNIYEHRVTFLIRGSQLYVYLVTPERRSPDTPPNGPKMYHYRKTITLYPDQPKR